MAPIGGKLVGAFWMVVDNNRHWFHRLHGLALNLRHCEEVMVWICIRLNPTWQSGLRFQG